MCQYFFTIVEFKMERLLWLASDLFELKLTEKISTLMQRHGQRKSRVGCNSLHNQRIFSFLSCVHAYAGTIALKIKVSQEIFVSFLWF